jgi:hypothetical protein
MGTQTVLHRKLSVRTAALAKEHCKKFDKEAEAFHSEMPGILLGIIQDTYQCLAK